MNNIYSKFMLETIEIAKSNPTAPYGATIVYDNKEILFTSVNNAHINPIMHGEISILHILFSNGFTGDKNKLSLYTTAEPCPMCASAVYWSMIPRVIYGSSIPFLDNLFGRQIRIRASEIFSKTPNFYKCELIGGIMENECNQLFLSAKKLLDSK